MDKWSEVYTAYSVARLGTISAAANALEVHRATVIRHINSLEAELETKLFFRHSRGYSLTEAGEDLLRTATKADKQLQKLRALSGLESKISGDLAISSHDAINTVLLTAISTLRSKHPRSSISLQTERSANDLETRRADISIHQGEKPTDLDYVVLPFARVQFGLYANQAYLKQNGLPQSLDELFKHHFIGLSQDNGRCLLKRWLQSEGIEPHIALQAPSLLTALDAIKTGIGIGLCPNSFVKDHPDIYSMWPHQDDWCVNYWIVTHMDMHRSAKVQAFLETLRGLGFLGRVVPTI